MSFLLKIAIIGDYNFTFNSHHATNISLDHSANFLDLEINYYWIRVSEAVQHKPTYFDQFDGVWIAPGTFQNLFFLNGIFNAITNRKIPVLITGEAFKFFIDFLILNHNLNLGGEKLISENPSFTFAPLPKSKKQIQYISNGRLLNDTLFFYYYDMLRLTHKKHVNEQTIVKYAYNRYALINKIDYDVNWPIAKRDVKAAKAYVLDRWNYMTNLN
jgi:hypothetical protein